MVAATTPPTLPAWQRLLAAIATLWTRRQNVIATVETGVQVVEQVIDVVVEVENAIHPPEPSTPLSHAEVDRIEAQQAAATSHKVPAPADAPPVPPRPPPRIKGDT